MPTGTPRRISAATARRLAISRQRLAGPRPATDADGMMEVLRDLGCLQLDPISVVAKSHRLVLWSRLGSYDAAAFDRLLWEERRLFEYWAHAASIVLTEDYPIHRWLMRRYPSRSGARSARLREWIADNDALRRNILRRVRRDGPIPARALEDLSDGPWTSAGWTNERNVNEMLDVLWTQGALMVAGRRGGQKLWDLSERCLPAWTPRERLGDLQLTGRAAERSLRSLGAATLTHVRNNFTVDRYPELERVFAGWRREPRVEPVEVAGEEGPLPGEWFVHAADLELLDRIEAGEWEPRTTLLSPFDNLIRDRRRLETLFGLEYRMEIYVPKAMRRYGYYALPVLHGDRLIGRVDPAMDRANGVLVVNSVHEEPNAPATKAAGRAVARSVNELAAFLGASEVVYEGAVPDRWRTALR